MSKRSRRAPRVPSSRCVTTSSPIRLRWCGSSAIPACGRASSRTRSLFSRANGRRPRRGSREPRRSCRGWPLLRPARARVPQLQANALQRPRTSCYCPNSALEHGARFGASSAGMTRFSKDRLMTVKTYFVAGILAAALGVTAFAPAQAAPAAAPTPAPPPAAAAGAAGANTGPTPSTSGLKQDQASATRPATQNWLKVCDPIPAGQKAAGQRACIMRQVVFANNQFLGSFLLRDDPGQESRLLAVAAVPLGVLLPFGLTWQIDGGKPIRVPYMLCDPQSCASQLVINEQYVNALKK